MPLLHCGIALSKIAKRSPSPGLCFPKKHVTINWNTVTHPKDPRRRKKPEIKQSISCWQVKSKWQCDWTTNRDDPNLISICPTVKITFHESFFGHKELAIKNKMGSKTRPNTSLTQVTIQNSRKCMTGWKKNDRGALQAHNTICRLFNYCERKLWIKRKTNCCFYYAPAIFNGGAYSITAVRTYVHPVCNTFGFCAISFERIGVLDWNFIHRYIIIKCRSSLILGKICQLFWELWPFSTLKNFQLWKMVSVRYLLKGLVYWIEILYTGI